MYDNNMYYDTYNSQDPSMVTSSDVSAGAVIGLLVFGLIILAVVYVITSLLWARIFKKAGVKEWKAWVPVYNNWIALELGDQKGFWAVLQFIPIVNIVAAVFMFIAMHNIGRKLGKESAFVLLAIFLPLVWLIWLAIDSSTWKGAKQPSVTTSAAPTEPIEQSETPKDDGNKPTPSAS